MRFVNLSSTRRIWYCCVRFGEWISKKYKLFYEIEQIRKVCVPVSSKNMLTSLSLHCKRIACVLKLNSSATNLDLTKSVSTDCGWMKKIIDGRDMLAPQWDTLESNRKTDQLRMAILKKCGCAKSRCLTNRCSCRKNGRWFLHKFVYM